MTRRWASLLQLGRMVLRQILLGLLLAWAAAAPIVWIVRDGLGPGSVETGWIEGGVKFLVLWGLPALVFVVPLYLLALIDRPRAESPGVEGEPSS